jgi:hypothetical protein
MLECIITETKDIEPSFTNGEGSSGSPTMTSPRAVSKASGSCISFRERPTPSTGTQLRRKSCSCSRVNATCAWAIAI